jgi:hypothetical protein
MPGRCPSLDVGQHAHCHAYTHNTFDPTLKTEHVTLLTSPEFKAFLSAEARREGVSVAELVRTRCERRPTEEVTVLEGLTSEFNRAVAEANFVLERRSRSSASGSRRASRQTGQRRCGTRCECSRSCAPQGQGGRGCGMSAFGVAIGAIKDALQLHRGRRAHRRNVEGHFARAS